MVEIGIPSPPPLWGSLTFTPPNKDQLTAEGGIAPPPKGRNTIQYFDMPI